MLSLDDTIAAIATAPGGAARGIIRLSGPDAVSIIRRCFVPNDSGQQWTGATEPSVISGRFRFSLNADDLQGELNDIRVEANAVTNSLALAVDLFLWPTNRSYTRQPVVEIHTIGSPPLLDAVLHAIVVAGARLAQPGEFTLRAFLSGRIDLTQAEAVLGVIDAADGRQLQTALEQLAGGLSRPLGNLRSDLLDLLADLEAGLDFVEDDIRFIAPAEIQKRLATAQRQLEQITRQLRNRASSNISPRVVLVGWPNVGKSSLFNALVGNPAAIVSPQAGTTRDYLTATVKIDNIEVELVDTAGMTAGISADTAASEDLRRISRENPGEQIDAAAQEASLAIHRQADLRLLCIDSGRELNSWERQQLSAIQGNLQTSGPKTTEAETITDQKTLIVETKCDDRQAAMVVNKIVSQASIELPVIAISSRTTFGLENLRAAITQTLAAQPADSHIVASTAARAGESIRRAAACIDRVAELLENQAGEELLAAEIRAALVELGMVVGAVYTDDLLDRIFSRFCIGK